MTELMAICPDLLAVATCIFLVMLLRENRIAEWDKTRRFAEAVVALLAVLVVEIATVYIDAYGTSALNLLDELLYIFIYAAAPVLITIISSLFDERLVRIKVPITIFLGAFAAFIASNLITHQIFTITGDTLYQRGPLYPAYIVAAFSTGTLFVLTNIQNAFEFHHYRTRTLIGIVAVVMVFSVLEIADSSLLVIWPAFSLAMLIYYIFLREMQFSFDALTGVFNRMMFSRDMNALAKDLDVALVMLDLDHLKEANDSIGHDAGDNYLRTAANLMSESFAGGGTVYRIGGDEFVIICHGFDDHAIKGRLARLRGKVDKYSETAPYDFGISYGYAIRQPGDDDLYATLVRADGSMYENKPSARRYYHSSRHR